MCYVSVAKLSGNVLRASAHLLDGGGEALARLGVRLGPGQGGGRGSTASSQLSRSEQSLVERASRGLLCSVVCPLEAAAHQLRCLTDNCDTFGQPQEQRVLNAVLQPRNDTRGSQDGPPALIDLGQILAVATNILTDIAFIKLKLLQGLFSTPNCWLTNKNDDNQCISKLCNYTEQPPKLYTDAASGVCTGSEDFLSPDKVKRRGSNIVL